MTTTSTRTSAGQPGGSGGVPTPPRRRLVRRTDDKIVAGVASGLAAYLDLDPAIVRIGFVLLTIFGGIGIPAYLVAWLVMPAAGADEAIAQGTLRRSNGPAFWIGLALIVIALASLADTFWALDGTIVWALILIAGGVALLRPRDDRAVTASGSGATASAGSEPTASDFSPTQYSPTQYSPTPETTDADTGAGGVTPPPAPPVSPSGVQPAWTPPPVAPKQKSYLGRLTMALLLVYAGVAWLLTETGVLSLTFQAGLAVALIGVGLALVVGAWYGRARGLILLGILMLPVLAVSAAFGALDVPFEGGFGERNIDPSTVDALDDTYRLAAGSMELDLRDVDFTDSDVALEATVTFGELIVRLPDDVAVNVITHAAGGELRVLGRTRSGTDVELSAFVEGADGTDASLRLDLAVGFGEIRVLRSGGLDTVEFAGEVQR